MSPRALRLDEIADLTAWRALQARVAEVTALRLGLWDEDANRVLPPPMPPPACQYVLSEPGRQERCEQFHGSVRAEVRRRRKPTCATCPFGVLYMAVPIIGDGVLAGHWEGGYVVEPGPPAQPDSSLDPPTWFAALNVTPHRTFREVEAALGLLELLHRQAMDAMALRERRRAQVVQVVGYELTRVLAEKQSPAEALTASLHLIAQVMEAPLAALYLKSGEELKAVATEGLTATPGGDALTRRVLAEDAPALETELAEPPHPKARAAMAVPVRAAGGTAGVLLLASYAPNAFVSDDLGLLARLAELVEGVLRYPYGDGPGDGLAPFLANSST